MSKRAKHDKTAKTTEDRWVHPKRRFVCITRRGVGVMTGRPYEVRECFKILPDGRILTD